MKSLRARLLLLLSSAVLAAVLLQALVVFVQAMRQADALFDYHLQQVALALSHGNPGYSDAVMRERARGVETSAQVWAADGSRIYLSHPSSGLPLQAVLGYTTAEIDARSWRVFAMQAGGRTIQVSQPLQHRRVTALRFALASAWPALLIAPPLLLLVALVVTRSLQPLRELGAELENRAATATVPLEPQHALQELQPVVRAMNGLFARTRAAFDAQQVFVADAAHELRSPLAALQLQLQLLERADSADARAQAASRLQAGLTRATRLVEQLLALARADASAAATTTSLTDALRQALADTVHLARSRDIDCGLDPSDEVAVLAQPEQLRMLARNLLDNALRYTPSGGRVDARVRAEADAAVLEVDDSGPGIAADERGRVFDRFWRSPQAPSGGSGLGLAIVHSVAERGGARITLLDSPLGGLRVQVRWPRPPGAPAA